MRTFRFLIVVFLLALPAGASVAEEPQKPQDRWAKEMAAFAKQDKQKPYPAGNVVFVGSSSIRLWDLAGSFPDIKPAPLNRGFGGSQIADTNRNLDLLVLKHKPRLAVMYAGDNDIAAGKSPARVHNDFQEFAKRAHQALPKVRIAYIAIKPSIKRWRLAEKNRKANELIAGTCQKDTRLTYVDIWKPMLGDDGKPRPELFRKDGLHLNDKGYKVWSGVIGKLFSKDFRAKSID